MRNEKKKEKIKHHYNDQSLTNLNTLCWAPCSLDDTSKTNARQSNVSCVCRFVTTYKNTNHW